MRMEAKLLALSDVTYEEENKHDIGLRNQRDRFWRKIMLINLLNRREHAQLPS